MREQSLSDANSPFSRQAYEYIERGYSVIPIAPGTKRPGQWSQADGWRGMSDWERFSKRLPTQIELDHWYQWPEAGIGLLLGKLSGVIGLDRDYNTNGTDALDRLIPWTPVKKKGAKGWTGFYRYNGERSCSFNIGGIRVLDVLSEGRQTLMPGTLHPEGHTYVYLTEDRLQDFDAPELPVLPNDFFEQIERTIAPYQNEEDRKVLRKPLAHKVDNSKIDTGLSIQGQYFREVNEVALANLDAWVPRLVPNATRDKEGYRCVAIWRNVKNPNVGIHPRGIFDFGGNYGMTPIDIVMYLHGLPFNKAVEVLRSCLPIADPEPFTMTVGGVKIGAPVAAQGEAPTFAPPPPPVIPAAKGLLPWQKPPVVATESVQLPSDTSFDPAPAIEAFILNPPGILKNIADWITATAPKSQPELSVAAAIALCSTVMGRGYRSQYGNWTSLYLVMVAKSTEGKEHPQACAEKILTHSNLHDLIGGSGYTSAGAVFSALLKNPAHLVTIDEMGKLLQLSRAKGQSHTEAALDKLIEAYGRTDGILRPPTYSTMTLKDSSKPSERVIHNPSITMLGATTPGTFYAGLSDDLVHDGFLGRCIVVESRQPRQLTRFVDRTDPPKQIIDWARAVYVERVQPDEGNLANLVAAEIPPNATVLPFDESCRPLMDRFEEELNEQKEAAEADRLDVLLGRTLEKALRLAMIVAKAENPQNKQVKPPHLEWAIKYVRHYDLALVRAVRRHRFANQTDEELKRAVELVKNCKQYLSNPKHKEKWGKALEAGAMPHSLLLRLMHMKAADFQKLMDTAKEAGLLMWGPAPDLGAGTVYFVAESAD